MLKNVGVLLCKDKKGIWHRWGYTALKLTVIPIALTKWCMECEKFNFWWWNNRSSSCPKSFNGCDIYRLNLVSDCMVWPLPTKNAMCQFSA